MKKASGGYIGTTVVLCARAEIDDVTICWKDDRRFAF